MGARIAVYGASGYTGSLVARELRRRGHAPVLAGRSAKRLRALADELGGEAEVRTAAVDDLDALRHAIGDADTVINCAGPFVRHGEPVVRAAVQTGTHYVDTTGEQPFIQRVFERHDDAARAAEVAVVPALGFDYAPGDLICRLAARGHEPLRELVVAYAVSRLEPTRGTLRSALEMMKGGDVVYEEGGWRPAGSTPLRARFPFPSPVGTQPVARYPAGEVVTVPRHTRTRRVTAVITASTFLPIAPLGPGLPIALPVVALALRTPLRAIISQAIGRLPAGPGEEARRRSRFTVVARAIGEDGRIGEAEVHGSDVYGITAKCVVHGALLLAEGAHTRSGVLAPAAAFDPVAFLNFLTGHGLSYEIGASPVGSPQRRSPV